ncbi:FAD binding domain-containing protein [Aspergillus cavernicola]|uniref:FAD binding domain-containing protein n=1 Tax=Aspergillus cavernicola TaxID=176166 RepID=A0ABR4IBU0_9EURO
MGSAGEDQSHVDVLIVGAGPAGLMMATWLAKCGVKTRIVDKRGTKVFNGQADGLQCRTLEIFDSFGFGDRAWKEANHMLEICLWNPDSNGVLQRSARIADTIPGISRFQQVVLHQGRIERFFLDSLESCSDIRVERGVLPTKLELDESLVESPDAYPITVHLRHLSEAEATPTQTGTAANGSAIQDGLFRSNLTADDTAELTRASALDAKSNTEEVVKAKYMLGADGAHSWVRQQLGFTLEGESTDYIWGVLDIVPITNFPDIRMRCAIHSADSGSVMVIPRESKLVRLYIQLTTAAYNGGKRADRSKIDPDAILQAAQKIMAPYKISYRRLDWWTAYQIGQRVGTQFSAHERIFLAGDAVHTHSPKAGQGMNVSLQDSFNLGWKVASVVKGLADRSILKTYESERRKIAQDLIAFDHQFSRLFSGRPARDIMDEAGISMEVFKEAFEKGNMFASGIAVDYCASVIVAKETESNPVISTQELAPEIKLGKRIPSVKILSQADARPWHLQERLPSNGRWRVMVFAGDVTKPSQKEIIERLGAALDSKTSFLQRYKPAGAHYDSVIEVLTVHAAPRNQVDIFDFPEVFRPYDEIDGWDYEKIFVDDISYHEGHGRLYETFGINPEEGCLVVLRPDQYVSYVGRLDDYDAVDRFFSGFMVAQTAQ